MWIRKALPMLILTVSGAQVSQAQLFETRTTRFASTNILDSLKATGTQAQIDLRDSIINLRGKNLAAGDTVETFYDGLNMGLIIYRDRKPHTLLGFWGPEGDSIFAGELKDGHGTVKTPFNPAIVKNFANESVVYLSGMKTGPVFYYCDCASVLRSGTFSMNRKEGLWKEFTPAGVFVKEKEIKVEEEPVEKKKKKEEDIKWIQPAHCMMRNPNEGDIVCPKG